ncbi:YoaK family protein [Thioclava sp. GXIMD2076]|uniref:YoaK family protein n=1 Tax=Thioclava kandeliae TaxID=3070818 RepID=A0ABV1SI64_9RHOB
MLIRVGEERTEAIDISLAGVLSFVAGGLNAVGFIIVGSFTANMTGNVSAMADEIATGHPGVGLLLAVYVSAFIAGAMVAALMIAAGEKRGVRSIYALGIGVEGIIVAALGAALLAFGQTPLQLATILLLSFVMGLQNAVTTMISKAKVRSTHVSGMATDIGIELAALLGDAQARKAALPKLRLHSVTLAAFTLGGIVCAVLFTAIGMWVFWVAAFGLMMVSGAELYRACRLNRP